MVNFTLKQLTYFSAVAEHGGIAQAARALNISEPAIASAVDKLEQMLGFTLLVRRHARGTELTSVGREAVLIVRQLLARADEADRRMRELGADLEGELRLGCYETLAPFYLPGLLRLMRRQHPNIECVVSEGRGDELITALANAEIDLALCYDMNLAQRGLVLERVASLEPYVLLSGDHTLANEEGISLRALADDSYVQLDWPATRELFAAILERGGLAPAISLRSQSFELVRSAVANGLGFSLLYARPASDIAYDGKAIACLPIKEPMPPLDIVLARPSRGRSADVMAAFTATARAYFSGL